MTLLPRLWTRHRPVSPVLTGPRYARNALWLEVSTAETASSAWESFQGGHAGDTTLARVLHYVEAHHNAGARLIPLHPELAGPRYSGRGWELATPGDDWEGPNLSGTHYLRLARGGSRELVDELFGDSALNNVHWPAIQYPLDAPRGGLDTIGILDRIAIFFRAVLAGNGELEQWGRDKCGFESVLAQLEKNPAPKPIGVLDQGIYNDHTELKGLIETRKLPSGGTGISHSTHATAVAAVIGAHRSPREGISGCCSAMLYLYNVWFADDDNGYDALAYCEALQDAVKAGLPVMNISLGSTVDDSTIAKEIRHSVKQKLIIVAAAGNNGDSAEEDIYPAKYDDVIAVGATDASDDVATWSANRDYVWISAPGDSIISTTLPDGFGVWKGTSFAAPFVTAAVWLALRAKPGQSLEEICRLLKNSAVNGNGTKQPGLGWGRLDMPTLASLV